MDGCENQAIKAGGLCEYHKLKKQSERIGNLKKIKDGLIMVVPLALSGIAFLKGGKGFKKQ